MYKNIVVDTNDLYHRSFWVKSKEPSKDILNETLKLTVQQILNIKAKYLSEKGRMWILSDNPVSKKRIRKQLDPNYKATRLKESDHFYRGIDFTLLLFSKYSEQFNTCRIKNLEADDLVKPLLATFDRYDQTLLVSADMDWARCMAENVDWLSRKKLYTQETFKSEYKFTPNEQTVTLYKVLRRDDSDNIPGIPGINEQTALNIVYNFYDVYDLLDTIQQGKEKVNLLSEYTKKHILDSKDRILLNQQLVYFNDVTLAEVKQAMIPGEYNPKALAVLYQSFGFPKSFDSRIEYTPIPFDSVFSFDEIKRKG